MTFQQINKILRKKTVGIAGAGGLGSNCAVALARVGIGKIIISDYDVVSKNNLNRQYYFHEQLGQRKVFALQENIHFINPNVVCEPHAVKLNTENLVSIYQDCDVIVEAFDEAEMKQMIIEIAQTMLPEIPMVVGSGMAGWGDNNSLKCRQSGNLFICGDEKSETADDSPPLAPRVGIVANMQANTVLEILLKNFEVL
jgi:sulfur carrier protein ThiS adenylyltransferase